jgi:hypothetical protein
MLDNQFTEFDAVISQDLVRRFESRYLCALLRAAQTGHGLTGTNYTTDGDGNKLEAKPIPNTFDRLALLTEWGEKGTAPGKSVKVTAGEKSRPMCSYPEYPKYVKGPTARSRGNAVRADRSIRRSTRKSSFRPIRICTTSIGRFFCASIVS